MATLTAAAPRAALARPATAWLALGAVAGPVLFAGIWLALGFVSPGYTIWGTTVAPYSPISAPISGLGLGPTGPLMNAAFVAEGLLGLVGVIAAILCVDGLTARVRWTCGVLLGLSHVGAIVDGVFTLESGFVHFIGFVLACGVPVVSFFVTAVVLRGVPRWRPFGSRLIWGSPLTLALVVLFFITFSPTWEGAQTGFAGLTERALIVEVLAWFAALGWLAFRTPRAIDGGAR